MNKETQTPTTKRCAKCGLEKPLTAFQNSSARRDGLNPWCRSCNANQKKAYRQANKEEISGRAKTYYEANRERILAKQKAYQKANRAAFSIQQKAWRDDNLEWVLAREKAYREANKKEISARKKAWHQANRERISAQKKAYREANREAVRLRIKAWSKRNPERCAKHWRANIKRRRARKRGAIVLQFTPAMEQAKYQEQNGRCYYRGEELNGVYDVEHRVPLCRSGAHSPDNIVLACRACNREKWTMTDSEFFELIKAESAKEVA